MSRTSHPQDEQKRDLRLSVAMAAAFEKSIAEVLAEASDSDLTLFGAIVHDKADMSVEPAHPVLAALAKAHWLPASAVCLLMEEAHGVHRDALLYLTGVAMRQTMEWSDQGEFVLNALASLGYVEDVKQNWYAPALYTDQLLAGASERLGVGRVSADQQVT